MESLKLEVLDESQLISVVGGTEIIGEDGDFLVEIITDDGDF